ncbi:hypothetical protein [Geminicoccus roseus]|uniref:hypothetical protein n=1 Tax=Geminicoccus roseus TaxID=404900 RepID=UPI0003FF21E3|nr:hypothetical protein [Geminicoccus roseus]
MNALGLGDEVLVRSACETADGPPARTDMVWSGRILKIDDGQVTMSVRTGGGAEVLVQAIAQDIRRRRSGKWEVVLPMRHRRMEVVQA